VFSNLSEAGLENGDDDEDSETFEDAYDQIQQSPTKESALSDNLVCMKLFSLDLNG
jgi:hypothetical protein